MLRRVYDQHYFSVKTLRFRLPRTDRAVNTAFTTTAAPIGASAPTPRGIMPLRLKHVWNEFSTTADSGFQNQSPLPRRLVPNAFAGVCLQGRLQPGQERRSTTSQTEFRAGVAIGFGTMNHDAFITIGERHGWGDPLVFGISQVDQRQHIYVIGKTGSGKTTLLRNMIVQHIALGHGLGLIDPHGDLAEGLLDYVPPSRADHLCYFNPGDLEFPIGINLIANVAPDDRHLVASGIVGAFKGIWRDSWGPRLEYILYNAVSALLDCENSTLLGVNRLLTDDKYRASVIRQIKDPFIRSFWADEYAGYDPRFQREAIAPIQNKIGQFLLNPVVRNILGQVKSKVSIPFIMDTGRLFIANLSKGQLGHDKANLLGSLLATQFQLAAMARSKRPENERPDFYLFIDEFQNFSTDAFASILAEARKYRLCLIRCAQVSRWPHSRPSGHIMNEVRDLHARWPKMTHEDRRKTLELFVKDITVGKGEISLNLY